MSHHLNVNRHAVSLLAFAAACAILPGAAAARPTAAVVLGDSFASGEGGRWRGNSVEGLNGGSRGGTDIAAYQDATGRWTYNGTIAYEPASYYNGCDRSKSASITYLKNSHENVFNLACSGARNENLWPGVAGGKTWRGESSQIERLGELALQYDIRTVVVSVGVNDMGFGDTINRCVQAWLTKHWTFLDGDSCVGHIEDKAIPRLGDVHFNVYKTISQVRKELAASGQTGTRIVLTGYPNVIPGFYDFKYEAGDRRFYQCPFNGPDVKFIDTVLVPKLNATLEAAAHAAGVDFVWLEKAFHGHRLCEADTLRARDSNLPSDLESEWVRYIDTQASNPSFYVSQIDALGKLIDGVVIDRVVGIQGSLQESMHPNYYGQKAVGHCLRAWLNEPTASVPKNLECEQDATKTATGMRVKPRPAPSGGAKSENAKPIPDGSGQVLQIGIDVTQSAAEPGNVMRSELQIVHPLKGQLEIDIVDPNGKVYTLRDVNLGDTGAFPSVSRNFWVDAPFVAGRWSLRIKDVLKGTQGYFKDWKLFFY